MRGYSLVTVSFKQGISGRQVTVGVAISEPYEEFIVANSCHNSGISGLCVLNVLPIEEDTYKKLRTKNPTNEGGLLMLRRDYSKFVADEDVTGD